MIRKNIYNKLTKSIITIILFVGVYFSTYAQSVPVADETVNAIEQSRALDTRMPSDKKLDKYRSDKRFNYEEKKNEEEKEQESDNVFSRFFTKVFIFLGNIFAVLARKGILTWIVVAIVIVALAVIVMKLIKENTRYTLKKKNGDVIDIYTEDVNEMNFDLLINNAIEAGNYRMAIRYLYLMNLKLMSDRSIIQWNMNKTNRSYLYEIVDNDMRSRFLQTTNIFDYVWYGEFPLDTTSYTQAQKYMVELANKIQQ